jgi:L-rhamnose mutarotase
MNRIGFVLKVRADRLEEYRREHESVWPEMLDALRRHGWHNYSLFLQPDGTLFGYLETPGPFQEALDGMADEEVNARWQERMAPFFEPPPGAATEMGENRAAADTMMVVLDEVFHLD